jgi:hypothetical protein
MVCIGHYVVLAPYMGEMMTSVLDPRVTDDPETLQNTLFVNHHLPLPLAERFFADPFTVWDGVERDLVHGAQTDNSMFLAPPLDAKQSVPALIKRMFIQCGMAIPAALHDDWEPLFEKRITRDGQYRQRAPGVAHPQFRLPGYQAPARKDKSWHFRYDRSNDVHTDIGDLASTIHGAAPAAPVFPVWPLSDEFVAEFIESAPKSGDEGFTTVTKAGRLCDFCHIVVGRRNCVHVVAELDTAPQDAKNQRGVNTRLCAKRRSKPMNRQCWFVLKSP